MSVADNHDLDLNRHRLRFEHGGAEDGHELTPYNTLQEGCDNVGTGGWVRIRGDKPIPDTAATIRITTAGEILDPTAGEMKVVPERVPVRYNVESTLTHEVVDDDNVIDFELTSE